jgi:bacterioferritin
MKGSPDVIAALNEVIRAELTASQQYLLGGARFRNDGYVKLATKLEAESRSEFEHARQVADRVLYLGGSPEGRPLSEPAQPDGAVARFEADLALETAHAARLNAAIAAARAHGDHGSAKLLEVILVATEEHVDWLETQLDLTRRLGEGLYLSQQL